MDSILWRLSFSIYWLSACYMYIIVYPIYAYNIHMKSSSECISGILERGNKYFISFNKDIYSIFCNSGDKEVAAEEIDKIFKKFLRFINYINQTNKETFEAKQEKIFRDICTFINSLDNNHEFFRKIYNSIPNITQNDYSKQTIWKQLLQSIYPHNLNLRNAWDGVSCSYRTIMLYDFFMQLKEAWLNIEVILFRFNELDVKFLWFPNMRHSWILIKFQWKNYIADFSWIALNNWWGMVSSIDEMMERSEELKKELSFFLFWNQKNSDKVTFFNDKEGFLKHIENFPEYQRISFRVLAKNNNFLKISLDFYEQEIVLKVWNNKFTYNIENYESLKSDNFLDFFINNVSSNEDLSQIYVFDWDDVVWLKNILYIMIKKINKKALLKYYFPND